jgi:hypothetical protein
MQNTDLIAELHDHALHHLQIAQVYIILQETIKNNQAAQRFALLAGGRAWTMLIIVGNA